MSEKMERPVLQNTIVRIALFCLLSLSLISWDKVSKELAKTHLRDQAVRSYLDDTIRLMYVENTGAAMSLADNLDPAVSFWLLGIVPLVILVGLFGYVVRHASRMPVSRIAAFSLIFSGGVGNILDRLIFDRHVTDFMNIGFRNVRTGIFNFADVWITAGVVCLLAWGSSRPAKTDKLTESTVQDV
jgi:signal peptidase II